MNVSFKGEIVPSQCMHLLQLGVGPSSKCNAWFPSTEEHCRLVGRVMLQKGFYFFSEGYV